MLSLGVYSRSSEDPSWRSRKCSSSVRARAGWAEPPVPEVLMTRKRFALSIAKITIVPVLAISVAGGAQIAGQSSKPQSSVESSVFKEVSPLLQRALKLGADGNYRSE